MAIKSCTVEFYDFSQKMVDRVYLYSITLKSFNQVNAPLISYTFIVWNTNNLGWDVGLVVCACSCYLLTRVLLESDAPGRL